MIKHDDAEFGIIEEECYFCGQSKVVLFDEHYIFCPYCMAVYTELMVKKSGCYHIKDGVPLAIRRPNIDIDEEKPSIVYVPGMKNSDGELLQMCSKCGAACLADGW